MEKGKDYVVHYYQEGKLNTQLAFERFKAQTGYRRGMQLWQKLSIAASILVVAAMATVSLLMYSETKFIADTTTKTYLLDDGSTVILAPHSSLAYYGSDCRKVEITGKAYLKIKHDAEHPFIVEDQNYTIKDIGTEFLVDETSHETRVIVTQGSVLFASPDHISRGLVLQKGESALMKDGASEPTKLALSVNKTAWATQKFHFDNTPLYQVLRDLTDYYHVNLTSDVSDVRLTGDFETENLDTILGLIEETLNIKIKKQ